MNVFRKRLFFFYLIVSLLILALVGRLVYIQVVWSDELSEMAKAQQNKNIPIPAQRGAILDRNGDKLAFSVKTYSVWAQASEITKQSETANLIAETLEIAPEPIIEKLLNAQSTNVKLVSNITKSEEELLKSKGIRGISVTEDTKRLYPYNSLASHVIGNVTTDGVGLTGLEYYFNDILIGEPGLLHVTTDVYGRQLAYGEDELKAPQNGDSLRLTLDNSIQFFVEDRLEAALELHDAKSVSAIVMDPKTGEILAMASKPDFDLNNPRTPDDSIDDATWAAMSDDERMNYWNSRWRNNVISDTFEPGSTFKALIAAVALEEKLIDFNTTFYCTGSKDVSGQILNCANPLGHGLETLTQAFVNSCNPAFIEIGQKIGVDTLYDYLEKFGVFEKTAISLPAEGNSLVRDKEKIGPVELATMSYGHGLNITMIQLIRIISTIVNGGYLIEPQLVNSIESSEGVIVETFEPKVLSQVISKETSDNMRILLESAVKSGGGKNAYIEGIRVGGKSGTTEKYTENGYESEVVVLSFVGIAPIEDPQYVVLVVVDEPKDEFYGSIVAAPVVKAILQDILRYKNIVPNVEIEHNIEVPSLMGLTLEAAIEKLDKLGLAYSTSPVGVEDHTLPVTNQYPAAGTKVDSDSLVIISVEE
ncbi:penicillin-binding transpeptidase domain-containing protein [Fusibacter bizertensis]|uniref:Penicillin-binding transpeptidase domain-containing protein n=1 Tax=Fusibacter bizertensis TaxID=1488331 RepID=A0ABT6N8H9_9FIRM|nr:penicillin-binding transpeptidase domain-containing protein [Fusibacter bizertensis]MDH8676721.1 penicillin-binding transpeptidase domain-containing protein [Fusibacter bizertensis]